MGWVVHWYQGLCAQAGHNHRRCEACQKAAVPKLPPGSARKRLASNIPSIPQTVGAQGLGLQEGSVYAMFHCSVVLYTL